MYNNTSPTVVRITVRQVVLSNVASSGKAERNDILSFFECTSWAFALRYERHQEALYDSALAKFDKHNREKCTGKL